MGRIGAVAFEAFRGLEKEERQERERVVNGTVNSDSWEKP
jgi:hypothetical protein